MNHWCRVHWPNMELSWVLALLHSSLSLHILWSQLGLSAWAVSLGTPQTSLCFLCTRQRPMYLGEWRGVSLGPSALPQPVEAYVLSLLRTPGKNGGLSTQSLTVTSLSTHTWLVQIYWNWGYFSFTSVLRIFYHSCHFSRKESRCGPLSTSKAFTLSGIWFYYVSCYPQLCRG